MRDNKKELKKREIAYVDIYKKNQKKYLLPFSKYIIYHKDGNKENDEVSNLELLTPRQFEKLRKERETLKELKEKTKLVLKSEKKPEKKTFFQKLKSFILEDFE